MKCSDGKMYVRGTDGDIYECINTEKVCTKRIMYADMYICYHNHIDKDETTILSTSELEETLRMGNGTVLSDEDVEDLI